MPKTDDKFQGWRPLINGGAWDKMTSEERRRAFWTDIAAAIIGGCIVYSLSYLLCVFGR